MKKYLVSAVLCVLTCMAMPAQNRVVNNPDNRAYFGLRLGGDIVCPGKVTQKSVGISMFDVGGGFEVGGIYNFPVVANFYLEPGLKLYFDTYSMKDEFADAFQDYNVNVDEAFVRKFGLRIPVMAGYHFDVTDDIKISVSTGPEMEIGLWAREYLKGGDTEVSGNLYSDEGGMNRLNLLWGFGAGISYRQFYFGMNGGIGMLNMLDNSDIKFHENRVTISLGYNF